jgi:CDP-diacylglycerol--serine O-phosphatidyltransferase
VSHWAQGLIWLGMVALLAFLMVSKLRYYSFKTVDLRKRRPYVAIIFLGLIVWAIGAYSEPVLLTLALTYLLSGIVLRLISRVRPRPAAPEEVRAA